MRKRPKSKAQRDLVTVLIVYASHRRPHARNQELKVDVRGGTIIDRDYAAGLVVARMGLSLDDVRIVRIEPC